MTFNPTAWAIDGALTDASLARTSAYTISGGAEGIATGGSLKVSQLDVAGSGFQITRGGAQILNRYQTPPTQSYAVENTGATTVFGSAYMPPVNASATSHLVCVVIGDPDFSQVGHPFMLASDPPAGQEATFQYVRVVVIPNVPGSTNSFKDLNKAYPAYALARIDLPAGTTTVTAARIVDLRKVARPRVYEDIFTFSTSGNNLLGNNPGVYENFPGTGSFSVDIPDWATVLKTDGFFEGASKTAAGNGAFQITLVGTGSTSATNFNEPAPAGSFDRVGYNVGGKIDIPAAIRGTTQTVRFQGKVNDAASKFCMATDQATGGLIRVRFEEAAS